MLPPKGLEGLDVDWTAHVAYLHYNPWNNVTNIGVEYFLLQFKSQ